MNLRTIAINKLKKRGVDINSLAKLIYDMQIKYNPKITIKDCKKAINGILNKREVIHTILTGISIDECIENKVFDKNLYKIINEDNNLYGIDEVLALSIVNIYGSIAFTSFGYLDKTKPGIIGILDKKGKEKDCCNTFLDDIVCAIVSAGCGKIAHKKKA